VQGVAQEPAAIGQQEPAALRAGRPWCGQNFRTKAVEQRIDRDIKRRRWGGRLDPDGPLGCWDPNNRRPRPNSRNSGVPGTDDTLDGQLRVALRECRSSRNAFSRLYGA